MYENSPLVSVITPCFNGEKYLDRYFSSILAQTYSHIELIFVDDGSTDRSYEKAESFRKDLEARGILFKLIHQENRGLAGAINRALPEVTGKYVSWPDCDDGMAADNIAKKVAYLEAHPEKAFVCCQVAVVKDGDSEKPVSVMSTARRARRDLFSSIIREDGAYCSCIAYLYRAEMLFEAIGGRSIYQTRVGQNWQLLLPVAYRYPYGFIDEPLVTYYLTPGSLSRSITSIDLKIAHANGLEDILVHVLSQIRMPEEQRDAWLRFVTMKYSRRRFELGVECNDARRISQERKILESGGGSLLLSFLSFAGSHGLGKPAIFALKATRKVRDSIRSKLESR